MSQAEELLNSMTDGTEGHIVIGSDRRITVPASLKRIAVQHDHNIETVTFDCPRYWDGRDMSTMKVFINYILSNGYKDRYLADNVAVDTTDDTIMHFDWTISKKVTQVKGAVSFLICIKKTDADGYEENHWNSELNKEMYVSEGLECEENVLEQHPDVIMQILLNMDNFNLKNGEGEGSIVQKQGSVYDHYGTLYDQSTADGDSATSLGTGNNSHGPNNFNAGHGNNTYQLDATATGAENVVGNKENHEFYKEVIAFNWKGSEVDTIRYLLEPANWIDAANKWDEAHPDKPMMYGAYDYFHYYCFCSYGFAGGRGNEVTNRAGASFGQYNKNAGENAFNSGLYNEIEASNSMTGGAYCFNGAGYSIVHGFHLIATGGPKAVFGKYNEDKGTWTLLEVGMGTSEDDRRNAFEIKKNGSAWLATQDYYDNSVVIYKTLRDNYIQADSSYTLNANGKRQINVGEPFEDDHAINFNYLQRQLKNYPKTPSEFPDGWSLGLYSLNDQGVNGIHQATSGGVAWSIAMRNGRGTIQCTDPQVADDVVTKRYLDNKFNSGVFNNGIHIGATKLNEDQLKKLLALLN